MAPTLAYALRLTDALRPHEDLLETGVDMIQPDASSVYSYHVAIAVEGHVTPSDEPGFGVALNPEIGWERPFQP